MIVTVKAGSSTKLQVVDIIKNTVTLGWSRPSSHAGDPLQGYIIEYNKVGKRWAPSTGTLLLILRLKVTAIK